MPSSSALLRGLKLLACSTLLFACQPKIGDDCSTSTDCSSQGTRSCDTTMPGGYCTIFNCKPDSCPDEAACIGFALDVSTAAECNNPDEFRGRRSFCMLRCSNDGDCRSGYYCRDLGAPGNAYGSALVDEERSSGKVCTLLYDAMPAADNSAEACRAGAYEDQGYFDVSSGGSGGGGGTSPLAGGSTSGGATASTDAAGGASLGGSSSNAVAGATQ